MPDPRSFHSGRLDLEALARRLGPDHGALRDDLVGLFPCQKCMGAGRPRGAVTLTGMPDYTITDAQRVRNL